MAERTTRNLSASYTQGDAFLANLSRRGPIFTLFVPTGRKLELGEVVSVLLDFPVQRCHFRLPGRVVARRLASSGAGLPAGVELEFGSDQARVLQLAQDCAEGKKVDFVERRSRRVRCAVAVEYRTTQGFVSDLAEDIGVGGTFLRTDRLLPVGALIECRLKPPGALLAVRLRARVAWVKERGAPRGLGLQFLFDTERQRRKVASLVGRLMAEQARRLAAGLLAFRHRSESS
jgi:uncharacterized protein (TIGR02266 family)